MTTKKTAAPVSINSAKDLFQYVVGLAARVESGEIDDDRFNKLDRVCKHMVKVNGDDVRDRATYLKAKEKGVNLAGHTSVFKRAA